MSLFHGEGETEALAKSHKENRNSKGKCRNSMREGETESLAKSHKENRNSKGKCRNSMREGETESLVTSLKKRTGTVRDHAAIL